MLGSAARGRGSGDRRRTLYTSLSLLALARALAGAEPSGIQATVEPLANGYYDDTPVCVRLVVENNTAEAIRLLTGIEPTDLVGFESASLPPATDHERLIGQCGASAQQMLPAKGKWTALIALDRFFTRAIGRHRVTFQINIRFSSAAPARDHKRFAEFTELAAGGALEIEIRPGALSQAVAAFRQAVAGGEREALHNALEPLLFWPDPRVIPVLTEAASAPFVAGYYAFEIAGALEKFLDSRQGQEALFEVMGRHPEACRHGLLICEINPIAIPSAVLAKHLEDRRLRPVILKHFVEHAQERHRRLLQGLTELDPDEQRLADAIVERLNNLRARMEQEAEKAQEDRAGPAIRLK